MGPLVGGRLEAVERPRSLLGPDYLRLLALAVVSVVLHAWLISHTALTARDSLGFARQALCFENPSASLPHADGRPKNTLDHIRAAEHPPGYPLAVWATDMALRLASHRTPADRVLLATQLANAIAAVLLVVPTYLLGRMLFSRNVGFAAALMFQVLPVPLRFTSDGLTEGLYLLGTGVAVLLAVRAVRQPRISAFLLCGLATGASYLVRPEGLMVAVGPGAVALWLGYTRRWPRDLTLARLTALCVGVGLVAVPYMALIGKISNKPTSGYMNPFKGPPGPIYRGGPENAQRAASGTALVRGVVERGTRRGKVPRTVGGGSGFQGSEQGRELRRVAARDLRCAGAAATVRDRTGVVGSRGASCVQPRAARVPGGPRRVRVRAAHGAADAPGMSVRGRRVAAPGCGDWTNLPSRRAAGGARHRGRVARRGGGRVASQRAQADARQPRRPQARRVVAGVAHSRRSGD